MDLFYDPKMSAGLPRNSPKKNLTVFDYLSDIKLFYRRLSDIGKTVTVMVVLVPGNEETITVSRSGSQRFKIPSISRLQ